MLFISMSEFLEEMKYFNTDFDNWYIKWYKDNKDTISKLSNEEKERVIAENFLESSDYKNDYKIIKHILKESKKQDIGEVTSWIFSYRSLNNIFADLCKTKEKYIECELVLEAQFDSLERADVVLVGTKAKKPAIIIIENKRWSKLENYEYYGENSLIKDNKIWEHPSRQAARYMQLLKDHNYEVQQQKIAIDAFVYMMNGTQKDRKNSVNLLHNTQYKKHLDKARIFMGDEIEKIKEYIEERIDGGKPELAKSIYTSKIQDSSEYIESLKNLDNYEDKLNSEQIKIFEEICRDIGSSKKIAYIIEGKSGTGKTFLASALLRKMYKKEINAGRLIVKNRDLRKFLVEKNVMLQGCLFHGLPKGEENYDCLICDEAHRMPKYDTFKDNTDDTVNKKEFIEDFINKCRIPIFFLDTKQTVHINDFVTAGEIEKKLAICKVDICKKRPLTLQGRCKENNCFLNSKQEIEFLEEKGRFLNIIDDILDSDIFNKYDTNSSFDVKLVNDPKVLMKVIKTKNNNRKKGDANTSRVVSGKGATEYHKYIISFLNQNQEYNRKIKWSYFFKSNPEKLFATNEDSINYVGCLDTCQGLDFEYIGVIIAPDLVFKNGKIKVEIENHRHDDTNVTGPYTPEENKKLKEIRKERNENFVTNMKDLVNDRFERVKSKYEKDPKFCERVNKIIRNTYRVLLSRGEKGCYIYCCDDKLRKELSKIFPILNIWFGKVEDIDNKNGIKTAIISCKSSNKIHSISLKTKDARKLKKNDEVTFKLEKGDKVVDIELYKD